MEKNTERKDINMMENRGVVTTGEIDRKAVIREIYEQMVDFIEEFRNTTGFTYVSIDRLNYENYNEVEAIKKYENISKLIRLSMLDIPLVVYNELLKFSSGFLESFLGSDDDYLWDVTTLSDDEVIQNGWDLSKLNPYHRQFIGYQTYLKIEKTSDTYYARECYVYSLCKKAYEILQEILSDYLIK